ncbi:MAG: hypothetical protein FJX67_00745 [Alphaproteobacteria bacterium]|nr:hypothetical protein [Alphaproteobacteria bacterium]
MKTKPSQKTIGRRSFVKRSAAAAIGTGVAITGFPAIGSTPRRLRYVTFINRNSVWGKPYDILAAEVDKIAGGELKIDFAGGSEVVDGFDAPEAVAKGVFDICHTANAFYAGAMPSSISLASGTASVEKLRASGALDAYADVLMQRRGVILLGVPMSGVGYVFQTRFRPDTLAAYKGKKIRSIPLYDPILQALGAIPVTTSPAEAYTALERGVVDGLGWPDIGLLDFKFYEHAKFIMAPTYYQLRTVTLINPNSFNRLPKELQDILVKASRSADQVGAAWCKEQRDSEHAQMNKHGLQIVQLGAGDTKQFVDLTEEKLWSQILRQSPQDGARLKALFDKAAA